MYPESASHPLARTPLANERRRLGKEPPFLLGSLFRSLTPWGQACQVDIEPGNKNPQLDRRLEAIDPMPFGLRRMRPN